MTAVAQMQKRERSIRPLRPWQDLRQVSDLIEEAFAGDLDSAGHSALREMRTLGRIGPLFWAADQVSQIGANAFSGFVWVEEGRIVGNVSLSRALPGSARWIISNVAVSTPYRGRGIATALMHAALEHIAQQKGRMVLLQVREDNTPARHLYHGLGFSDLSGVVHLRLERVPLVGGQPFDASHLRLRSASAFDTRAAFDLACEATTAEQRLVRPLREMQFQLARDGEISNLVRRLVGMGQIRHWAVEHGSGYVGLLSVIPGWWRREHRLQLMVHPSWRGSLEKKLIALGLQHLARWRRQPVVMRHPAEHREALVALTAFGFEVERTLIWMAKDL